jgi:hypothetical protein
MDDDRAALLEKHLDDLDDMRQDLAALRVLVRGVVPAAEGLGAALLTSLREGGASARAREREREAKLIAEAARLTAANRALKNEADRCVLQHT